MQGTEGRNKEKAKEEVHLDFLWQVGGKTSLEDAPAPNKEVRYKWPLTPGVSTSKACFSVE